MVSLNELIVEKNIYKAGKGTKIVELVGMKREFAKILKSCRGDVVVEGHLSHFLPKNLLTWIVVLRTRPKVLEGRLVTRGFRRKKLRENLEAEALDIILWETVKLHGQRKVFEIDTTKRSPKASVAIFLKAMKGKTSLKPGKVSWIEEFYRD